MKALQLKASGGLDQIQYKDVEDPGHPGPGEIRVAIKANALNYHDLLVANGAASTADGRTLLSDGAGTVEAVGDDVEEFKPGDSVVSTFFPVWEAGPPTPSVGGFMNTPGDGQEGLAAEYVVRPCSAFTHTPRGWSHVQSATITTSALTAWRALVVDGGLKAGETVLVQGTGGVSTMALQIARAMGARVIATSSSDDKLERVKQLGADHTINYKRVPQWGKQVLEYTRGMGVDHVVEVGGPDTFAQSIKAVAVGGHIAMIGVLSGMKAELSLMPALAKQVRIQSLIVGSRRDQQDFVQALEVMQPDPMVDKVFASHELADAFRYQQSGQHFGKICLTWD